MQSENRMTHNRAADVTFIVEYQDGRTARVSVNRTTLRAGAHVARFVAEEWPRNGRIPEGNIKQLKQVGAKE
jgi:hypothetical protein